MGILIDTDVFIDADRGRFSLERLTEYKHYGVAYMAAITVAELLAGVRLASSAAQELRRAAFAEAIIEKIPVLEFGQDVARTYANLYSHFLQAHGRHSHNVHHLQIAATAICHGHAVLTSNRADLEKVPGLVVECPDIDR